MMPMVKLVCALSRKNNIRFLFILLPFVLYNIGCNERIALPKCNHPHLQKTHPVTTQITFEYLPHFNGYIEDIKQAQACSKETGRKILLFFTGFTFSSAGKVWAPLQNKRVRELINDNYILCVLFCDNQQELDSTEYYYDPLSKDTIKTVGRRNLHLEATKYRYNTQPIYILVDENLKQVHEVIPYMGNDHKMLIDALEKNRPASPK